jgi:hypothetical protein
MSLREACIFDVQRMKEGERSPLGCLVLAMRKRMRFLDPLCVHIWMPDAGPSVELLAEVHAMKKRLLAASGKREESSFRRARLAPASLAEWDRYWFERVAPAYRRELHGRQACRVVVYGEHRTDEVIPQSPVDYLLTLEGQAGGHPRAGEGVTLMCCEPNRPYQEECHRRLLLADLLALQAVRSGMARGEAVRMKVRVWGEIGEGDRRMIEEGGCSLEPTPYQRLGSTCLYAAAVSSDEQTQALLLLPCLQSLEPMSRLSEAVLPS